MRVPKIATYRVQLRPEFGFDRAHQLVDYWAALGVSHLYTSPCLQAAAGSSHGYDVIDPRRVNEELGGEAGRLALSHALKARNMGQLLDIVPNHMAIRGGHNAWWWDVLENGPSSRYSSYFDVEWQAAAHDRVLLPLLGDLYGVELEHGRIKLKREDGKFLIQYYEHRTPVAPRSLGPILREANVRTPSDELGFLADAFTDLPLPNAPDRHSRERRHRDKQVLELALIRLLSEHEELGTAIDAVVNEINSSPDKLHEVLERQSYRLAYWRVGDHELDYRRFFDIDSLAGLRVEEDEVFDATHRLPLGWLNEGSIDGLRIDHIDGLYDPGGYLQRLRVEAPQAWLLVEKILEGNETLPEFPVEGSTGYDFLNHVQRLLVQPEGESVLSELHRKLNPAAGSMREMADSCKRQTLEEALASDLKRLVERLSKICQQHRHYRDFSRVELMEALRELCVSFPVYRTYVRSGRLITDADRWAIEHACKLARKNNPALDQRLFDFIERLLLLEWDDEAEREFVMRWQQLTGPAMAKGLEDTAFYRHCRLVALNEVGGDPGRFSETPEAYHTWTRTRQSLQPCPLNATSTHDTKRSEDVRARLLVLSEVPERWAQAVTAWQGRLQPGLRACRSLGLSSAPEPATEYFLLQNLVGAWPIAKERMLEYAQKAVREAKLYSSWQRPHEAYEAAVADYLERLYGDDELLREVSQFVESIADAGYSNSLNQLLLKVLSPGVPDIYQGTELWDFSLVDPDNRRPVDYSERHQALEGLGSLTPADLWASRKNGLVKLFFMNKLLLLRHQQQACFEPGASYEPLQASGTQQARVVAFSRGESLIGVATRWYTQGELDFGDTWLTLPAGSWQNALAPGRWFEGKTSINELLSPFPAAALVQPYPRGAT